MQIRLTDDQVICKVAEGDKADVDLAVKAAKDAFYGGWKATPSHKRALLL